LDGAVPGSPAAHGTAAAPSATVTLRSKAAVRLIDRLTCTSYAGSGMAPQIWDATEPNPEQSQCPRQVHAASSRKL
jgi:hypothetical protein